MSETVYYSPDSTFVTDSISTSQIAIQNDILKEWPYLIPSTSNVATILAGLTRLANTYNLGNVFWSKLNLYTLSTVTGGNAALAYTRGGVVLPDGRIVYPPGYAATGQRVGIYNPITNTYASVATGNTNYRFWGACLVPDGRVIFAPLQSARIGAFNPQTMVFSTVGPALVTTRNKYSGAIYDGATDRVYFTSWDDINIGVFNPNNNTFTTRSGTWSLDAYTSGCLHPNGNVYLPPAGSTNIGIFNPVTNSFTSFSGVSATNAGYGSACVIPDGRVILCPESFTNIGIFNPATNSFTTISGAYRYNGSCVLPDGRVVMVGTASTNIGIFNPATNSFTTISGVANAFWGCNLLLDGRVILSPDVSAQLGFVSGLNSRVPPDFCLHPMFNTQ